MPTVLMLCLDAKPHQHRVVWGQGHRPLAARYPEALAVFWTATPETWERVRGERSHGAKAASMISPAGWISQVSVLVALNQFTFLKLGRWNHGLAVILPAGPRSQPTGLRLDRGSGWSWLAQPRRAVQPWQSCGAGNAGRFAERYRNQRHSSGCERQDQTL